MTCDGPRGEQIAQLPANARELLRGMTAWTSLQLEQASQVRVRGVPTALAGPQKILEEVLQRAIFDTEPAAAARDGFAALLRDRPRIAHKAERFRNGMSASEVLAASARLLGEVAPHLTRLTPREASERFFAGLRPHVDRYTRLTRPNEMGNIIKPVPAPTYGFRMAELGGQVTVMDVERDSPAARAGLADGDVVRSINGHAVTRLADVDQAPRSKRGVTLTATRDGRESTITLKSAVMPPEVVALEHVDGVAVLRIRSFTQDTRRLVDEALARAAVRDGDPLVVDLRGNAGGTDPWSVAELFVGGGAAYGGAERIFGTPCSDVAELPSRAGDRWERLGPTLVMVNHGTASAAEAFARVLQRSGRAVVTGPGTHGKATAQARTSIRGGFDLLLSTQLLQVDGTTWNEAGLTTQPLALEGLDTARLHRIATSYADYVGALHDAVRAVRHPDFPAR